jgi:hypothetical protein
MQKDRLWHVVRPTATVVPALRSIRSSRWAKFHTEAEAAIARADDNEQSARTLGWNRNERRSKLGASKSLES